MSYYETFLASVQTSKSEKHAGGLLSKPPKPPGEILKTAGSGTVKTAKTSAKGGSGSFDSNPNTRFQNPASYQGGGALSAKQEERGVSGGILREQDSQSNLPPIDLALPPIARYVQACRLYGISFHLVDGELKVEGPRAAVDEIRDDIDRLKPELIEYLGSKPDLKAEPPGWLEVVAKLRERESDKRSRPSPPALCCNPKLKIDILETGTGPLERPRP